MNPTKTSILHHLTISLLAFTICIYTVLATTTPAFASSLRTSALISDNMVIQRDMEVPLWGWANPGEKITAALNDQTAAAVTNGDGKWLLRIGPFKSGGPYNMQINGESADSSKTISNILVGEVWIGSGQSNMRMEVGPRGSGKGVLNFEQEIASAKYPQIRMFNMPFQAARKPVQDVQGSWAVCSPETVTSFSATAYFFARDIHKELQVPVGIINNSMGARAAESYMSRETLESNPEFKMILAMGDKNARDFAAGFGAYMQQMREWEQSFIKAEFEGTPIPNLPAPIIPKALNSAFYGASRIFNGMVAPIIPYGLRGVIWYQGESNAFAPQTYYTLFPTLIREWREKWGQGEYPFLFVQLANYANGNKSVPNSWSIIREAQLQTLSLNNTAMAVAIDAGESLDIHPRNKQAVGHRLALAALAKAYGKEIPYSGPIYESMKVEGDKVRLNFKHTDGGLAAKDTTGNLTEDAALTHFIIAGSDQQFVPAQAKIEGDTVIVWADAVKEPAAVRYAWSNDPVGCNLYSKAALPASPFRTDKWTLPMKETE